MFDRIVTNTEKETIAAGKKVATLLMPGQILGLTGNLGSGKTIFAKGIASGFGIKPDRVNSPTYTLVNEYTSKSGITLVHADLYRIDEESDLEATGLLEYLDNDHEQKLVYVIEWSDRLSQFRDHFLTTVYFDITGKNSRELVFDPPLT